MVEGLAAQAPEAVFLHPRPGRRPTVDLRAVARQVLHRLGIAAVEVLGPCTRCDLGFHSWRRDGPDAGRQAALVGLLP